MDFDRIEARRIRDEMARRAEDAATIALRAVDAQGSELRDMVARIGGIYDECFAASKSLLRMCKSHDGDIFFRPLHFFVDTIHPTGYKRRIGTAQCGTSQPNTGQIDRR